MRFIETEMATLTGTVVEIIFSNRAVDSRTLPKKETTYNISIADGGIMFVTEGREHTPVPFGPGSIAGKREILVERTIRKLCGIVPVHRSYRVLEPVS